MNIFEKVKHHTWYSEVSPDELFGDVATMLSNGELKMLHWLARDFPLTGSIVDAGCFLGGSTLAFATGLSENSLVGDKAFRISSYDMFVAPNDGFALGLIGEGRQPGDTVLDLYAKSLDRLSPLVLVHAGDIQRFSPPAGEIDILFVDVAKTRDVNRYVVQKFFPQMVPGSSVLIQQDYNDHSCPWVNSTMEFFAEYFDYLCDESSSRVYAYKKLIPTTELLRFSELGLDQEIALMRNAIESTPQAESKYFNAVGLGWLLFERGGGEIAIPYLENIESQQPWKSDEPYVANVIAAMRQLGDRDGLDSYHKKYFVTID